MKQLLKQLLAIPSPTYQEQEIVKFIKKWFSQNLPKAKIDEFKDSLICHFPQQPNKPHLALVGHSDVVPQHFEPYEKDNRLYGSGASDMTGSLACYMHLMKEVGEKILANYNISLIIYSREEGTTIEQNGLYDLINHCPNYFKSIDLAIVGEPTDNTVQIGCVGSIHAQIKALGQACHSARPWNGENALYNALPIIKSFANDPKFQSKKHTLFGVDFFDVIQLTESHSQAGRTSLPGYWQANINFRYAPIYSEDQAKDYLTRLIKPLLNDKIHFSITDSAYAGKVIENQTFKNIIKKLGREICAKQAWTDVAQLTNFGISAFNFGAGLTSQAHQDNEYICLDLFYSHYEILKKTLT